MGVQGVGGERYVRRELKCVQLGWQQSQHRSKQMAAYCSHAPLCTHPQLISFLLSKFHYRPLTALQPTYQYDCTTVCAAWLLVQLWAGPVFVVNR
jgi:hypothetical protein